MNCGPGHGAPLTPAARAGTLPTPARLPPLASGGATWATRPARTLLPYGAARRITCRAREVRSHCAVNSCYRKADCPWSPADQDRRADSERLSWALIRRTGII